MTDLNAKFQEAWQARVAGKYDQAIALAEKGLALANHANDQAAQAMFLKINAQVASDKGELDEALKYYKQIEKLYIELGDDARQMHTLRHIGSLFLELGKSECAEKCLKQVVNHNEVNQVDILEQANTHRVYALTMELLKQTQLAIDHWEKARTIYSNLNITEGIDECEQHLRALYKQV